ncbi:hypothetical protein JNM05_16010 [bacterium]|nr:hypothetical protein [bacterium]
MQKFFEPFGLRAISLRFTCSECGVEIITDSITMPIPDYGAEDIGDSYRENDYIAECENCKKNYYIYVSASYGDAYVECDEIWDEEGVEIEEIPDFDEDLLESILGNTSFYDNFNNSISALNELSKINIVDEELSSYHNKLIYSSIITCLETYLSDAFINTVLGKEMHFRKFVETFKEFNSQKFILSELYTKMDRIKDTAKKAMLDVIYHDLPKVNGMYLDTLDVKFPNFGHLQKAIMVRHDIVHRNGKTKEGNIVKIEKKEVAELIKQTSDFVTEVENQIQIL